MEPQRVRRVIRFVGLLVGSWCVMTWTHEAGHIVGGLLSGGSLQAADLAPWKLPYSVFQPDPRPLVTLWCGPLLGVLVPCLLAVVLRRDWAWFIAHFCVLANGSYLALAWLSGDRLLDTPRLLAAGTPPLAIVAYCGLTIGWGYPAFRRSCIRALENRHLGAEEM